jgi:hypothetical protein
MKKYILYLLRWQLSTPILAVCVYLLSPHLGSVITTIIANLVGGLIFFWVDKYIFKHGFPIWEVKEEIECNKCKSIDRGYRLVKADNYNAENKKPIFLCEECSKHKAKELKKRGVKI